MNVVMVGAGYVGLVSGACFADFGAHVTCVDKDEQRISALEAGKIPIAYGPWREGRSAKRAKFKVANFEIVEPAKIPD